MLDSSKIWSGEDRGGNIGKILILLIDIFFMK